MIIPAQLADFGIIEGTPVDERSLEPRSRTGSSRRPCAGVVFVVPRPGRWAHTHNDRSFSAHST